MVRFALTFSTQPFDALGGWRESGGTDFINIDIEGQCC